MLQFLCFESLSPEQLPRVESLIEQYIFGPVVKWYYAAFALLSREFDSPQVHKRKNFEKNPLLQADFLVYDRCIRFGKRGDRRFPREEIVRLLEGRTKFPK